MSWCGTAPRGTPHGKAPLASSALDSTSVCAHREAFVSLAIPDERIPDRAESLGEKRRCLV